MKKEIITLAVVIAAVILFSFLTDIKDNISDYGTTKGGAIVCSVGILIFIYHKLFKKQGEVKD